jgi:hypothetical protein
MKTNSLKVVTLCLLAVAIAAAPMGALAKDKDKKDKASAEQGGGKKQGNPPIHGKLATVDKAAKTLTVGQTTIQLTADTKITKDGKAATLDDAVVGEHVVAMGKKNEEGKFVATSLRLGPKSESEAKGAGKKDKKDKKEN